VLIAAMVSITERAARLRAARGIFNFDEAPSPIGGSEIKKLFSELLTRSVKSRKKRAGCYSHHAELL
jgi:hypothetical protein